jgi:hypothetical protein
MSATPALTAQGQVRYGTPAGLRLGLTRAESEGPAVDESARPAVGPAEGAARVGRNRWWAPVTSAAIPGTGQLVLDQNRALPYLAFEAFAWAKYISSSREGRARRREYVELAREVARSLFSDTLPVGDFEYYERMEHFTESGVFDLVPGGILEPETDLATFNGTTWLLARQTFWEDPDVPPASGSRPFLDALDFYSRRAIRPEYRWSWRNAQLEQDLFRRTIERSNNGFRTASTVLGVIIANHALSAVDAFITLRLRRAESPDASYGIEGSIPWAPFGRPRRLTSER